MTEEGFEFRSEVKEKKNRIGPQTKFSTQTSLHFTRFWPARMTYPQSPKKLNLDALFELVKHIPQAEIISDNSQLLNIIFKGFKALRYKTWYNKHSRNRIRSIEFVTQVEPLKNVTDLCPIHRPLQKNHLLIVNAKRAALEQKWSNLATWSTSNKRS